MRLFLKIFDSGDFRWMLREYDEKISNLDIAPYFDALMLEYSKLSNNREYFDNFRNIDDLLFLQVKIKVLFGIIELLNYPYYDKEGAKQLIKEYNVRLKGKYIEIDDKKLYDKEAIEKIERVIKQLQTRINVSVYEQKTKKEDAEAKKEPISWEKMRVQIHVNLQVMPDYNCSIAQYLTYNNYLEEKIRQQQQNK